MADTMCFRNWCIALCFLSSLIAVGFSQDLSCIEVNKEYVKMGFVGVSPITAVSGDQLQICPQGTTCCTSEMEGQFKSLSMKEYDNVANQAFRFMKSTFVSRTKKFDEFFTELLDKSQKDLHEMFVRTYGLLYQQNSQVFSDLFHSLKSYYKGNNLNLVNMLNEFFINLLKKMFELLHVQYQFDAEYLDCVSKHMDGLKPFGDVPMKLKSQVKRAFVAARTFVQGLAIGRDVILAMEKIKPTEACTRGMTRMMYCPHCRGLIRTKPCNNYCLNTMKGCLAHHSELNKAWNEYIDALQRLGQRLEGPFNIETVMDPINVKLSEAIMNFQEESKGISDKIFEGCGTPRRMPNNGQRYKRDEYSSFEDYAYGKDFMTYQRGSNEKQTAAGTNLDKLVKDIKEKVQEARDFWVQLPYSICNGDIAAQPGEDENCWNGQDRARYVPEVQKDGRMHQVNNPEVTVAVQEDNGIISIQIHNLKLITTKLLNAFNGVEVESTRITQPGLDFSGDDDDVENSGVGPDGSGDDDLASGSGSGTGIDDEDEPYNKNNAYNPPYVHQPNRPNRPVRPTGPIPDSGFNNPNSNPTYEMGKPNNRPNQRPGSKNTQNPDNSGATTVTLTSVLMMLVSSIWVLVHCIL